MASTYTYKLTKASELMHSFLSSEKDCGVQAFLFKDCRKVKDDFSVHASMVEVLYAERPADTLRDMVFLMVVPPGKAFGKYNDEKNKIAMTLGAYLELLKFYFKEYNNLTRRMETDIRNMTNRMEWFTLNPFLSFRGPADILSKHILDATTKTTLEVSMSKEYKSGSITTRIAYTNEKYGSLSLPHIPFGQLSRDYQTICDLVDYKEPSVSKRPRQS